MAYISITSQFAGEKSETKPLSVIKTDCTESAAEATANGYSVIFPVQAGVKPGSAESLLVPASGGATIKFYCSSNQNGKISKNLDETESIYSSISNLNNLLDRDIETLFIKSLSDEYSSNFLNQRLKIQKILFEYSTIVDNNSPDISFFIVNSADGANYGSDLSSFSEYKQMLLKNKDRDFRRLGGYKYLSKQSILKILELSIRGTYFLDEQSVEFRPIIRTDSGISLFSLYIFLQKYISSDINYDNFSYLLNGDTLDNYIAKSDAKVYIDASPDYDWDTSKNSAPLDFLIKEFFNFFVPYFSVYDVSPEAHQPSGFYTVFDVSEGESVWYLKTPDFSFEDIYGNVNDRGPIRFGLKNSPEDGFLNEEYENKTFLGLNVNWLGYIEKTLFAVSYLPTPNIEISGEEDDNGNVKAILSNGNENNLMLSIDVSSIVGGEFQAFGLSRAPEYSDYLFRASISLVGEDSATESFSFIGGNRTKTQTLSEIDQFSFPNILGGLAITDSVTIENPEQEAIKDNFPCGNFNLAQIEDISKSSEDYKPWIKDFYSAISRWHREQVSPISTDSYMLGSLFLNESLSQTQGLSDNIDTSLGSYRSYFIQNGIPNTSYFSRLFGFKSLQDYLNFKGDIETLFIERKQLADEDDVRAKNEILEKNSLLASEDGILRCRPRIIDDSMISAANQLLMLKLSDLDVSKNSKFPKDADKIFFRINSQDIKMNNLSISGKSIMLNFHIIDSLGQHKRASKLIKIPKQNDLSSAVISPKFLSSNLSADDTIKIPLIFDDMVIVDSNDPVYVDVYADEAASNKIGTFEAKIQMSSDGSAEVSTDTTWSEEIGFSSQTSGTAFAMVSNSTSQSDLFNVTYGSETPIKNIRIDEFSFSSKNISDVPVCIFGDAPNIKIKSKSKLFFEYGSNLLVFYFGAIVNEQNIDETLRIFSKFSSYENIYIVKLKDKNGNDIEAVISKSFFSSSLEIKSEPSIFGISKGKFGSFSFPPKSHSRRNIVGLSKIKTPIIIGTVGGLSISEDVGDEVYSFEEIKSGDITSLRNKRVSLTENTYSPIFNDKFKFSKTPNIKEVCFIPKTGTPIASSELSLLTSFSEKRRSVFTKQLSDKVSGYQLGSNLNKKFFGDLLLAIDGSHYNPKDLLFYIRDDSGDLKEINGIVSKRSKYIYFDKSNGKDYTYIFIRNVKLPSNAKNFTVEVFYYQKELNCVSSGTNDIIESFYVGEPNGLKIFQSSSGAKYISFEEDYIIDLKRYPSYKQIAGVDFLEFPIEKTYSMRSDYPISASSKLGEDFIEFQIYDDKNTGFPIPDVLSLDLRPKFPPPIGEIVKAISPKVGIDVESGQVNLSITNPIDVYTTDVSSLSELSKIDLKLDADNIFYSSPTGLKNVKLLNIKKGTAIDNTFFDQNLYSTSEEGLLTIPVSFIGINKFTIGSPEVSRILVNGVEKTYEDLKKDVIINSHDPKVIEMELNGELDNTEFGVKANGVEISSQKETKDGKTTLIVPFNEQTAKEMAIASNLTNLAIGLTSQDPCGGSILLTDSDSEKRESEIDKRNLNDTNIDKPINYTKLDSFDVQDVLDKITKMELGYGKATIRKGLAGTKELIKSLCDMSFHMTSEFRAELRGLKNLMVIIKVIFCIIDVICAFGNPAKLGPAILRLFICLFDLLQLLPQLAIPIAFLKLLSHTIEVGTCIVTKVLRSYVALREVATAIEEAITFKDYASLTRLEAVLNKHLFSIEADLSVMDPILDILDLFMELLQVSVRFPCSGDGDGEVFGVCVSDSNICSIIIGEAIKDNSFNAKAMLPVAQSYSKIGTNDLTVDSNGNSTINCGNTPPDGVSGSTKALECFGSDNSDDIFIEPRLLNDSIVIPDLDSFDFDDEAQFDKDSLRTKVGDFESTFAVSFTKNKKPSILDSGIFSVDTRKCSFLFNYKGITNSLAFNNILFWLFSKKVIENDRPSDSPILPLSLDGDSLVFSKSISSSMSFVNPYTKKEIFLTGNSADGYTVPMLEIEYEDENGNILSNTNHSLPSFVILDESLNVYAIDKIFVNDDESSSDFGINRIDATRVGYPTFEPKKFIKEEEQYIAEPKIYYANANYMKLKSFFSTGDYGSPDFRTDLLKDPLETDVTKQEISAESISIMESLIHLFDKNGDTLYGNFGIIAIGSATDSSVISDLAIHTIGLASSSSFNFKGGYIFKKVYDFFNSTTFTGTKPSWTGSSSGPDFDAAKGAFLQLFEDNSLNENFGSFPYTEYIHSNQTFRDPTQSYLNAYTNSIGTADVFNFPTMHFFDMSTIVDSLVDAINSCSLNNDLSNLIDQNGKNLAESINNAMACGKKPVDLLKKRKLEIKSRFANKQGILDLDFIKDPTIPAKEIAEMIECFKTIAKSKNLCRMAISDLATEFLLIDGNNDKSDSQYVSTSLSPSSPIIDTGVEVSDLTTHTYTGNDKFVSGIGDNGTYFVGQEITVRVVLRDSDDSEISFPSIDFSESIEINIVSDSGGEARVKRFEGKQFSMVEYINDSGETKIAYEAIILSDIPSKIEISCSICENFIKTWAPSFLINNNSVSADSCNDENVSVNTIFSFGQLSKVPRILSIDVVEKIEEVVGSGESSSGFSPSPQPVVFGSQE